MATVTQTQTKSQESKLKSKNKNLEEATNSNDLDTVLNNIKKVDNTCSFTKCKNRTSDFAIQCKYCTGRFCTTHGLPEIHGCGEAVRRDEKRTFLHPHTKLSQEKHAQASDKLAAKLKQMQFERKAKQCKGKK
ncbi:hypothetical protein ILUMI_02705 [Ignelater luminosus]|uniref:AN1-type domain-containing protein n=1 Tax=Ignelater luminosus TaxID=2038154 RepID=A0A8K0DHP2_IGNLU|nr:hypothetical protein ILUMI_02705 [Ignelater luminosus]